MSKIKELVIAQNDELNQLKDQLRNVMEINVKLVNDLQAVNESVLACKDEISVLKTDNSTVTKTKVEELGHTYQQDLSSERQKWTLVADELKYLKVELFLNLDLELLVLKDDIQKQLGNEEKGTARSEQHLMEFKKDLEQKTTYLKDVECSESKKAKRRQRRKML